MTFRVGDRVKYTGTAYLSSPGAGEGVVQEVKPYGCKVLWRDSSTSTEDFSDLVINSDSGSSSFEQSVRYHTNKIADLLIAKNKAYGDSALNPVRIFSKASRIEQLNVRIDDKISRIQRGTDYEDEDTVRDLVGYLLLRLIAEESE